MALKAQQHLIFRGYPDTTLLPRSPPRRSSGDFLEAIHRQQRRLGLNKRSAAVLLAAAHALRTSGG